MGIKTQILDNAILEAAEKNDKFFNGCSFCGEDFKREYLKKEFEYTSAAFVTKVLKDMLEDYQNQEKLKISWRLDGKKTFFDYCDYENLLNATFERKDKNFLVFRLKNNKRDFTVTYDFISKKVSQDLSQYKIMPHRTNCGFDFIEHILTTEICLVPEWIFTYLDMCNLDEIAWEFQTATNLDTDLTMFQNCPKGYIPWVKENKNNTITLNNLKEYIILKEYGKKGVSVCKRYGYNKKAFALLKKFDTISTIVKNSWKSEDLSVSFSSVVNEVYNNYYWNSREELTDDMQIEIIMNLHESDTIKTIHTKVTNIINKELNEKIIFQQSKYDFLNNLLFTLNGENYVIKVPHNIAELEDEGNQQHNCVGHYYNKSIANGRDFIYFIRKEATPDKSFITCRYAINGQRTVEARTQYNGRLPEGFRAFFDDYFDSYIENHTLMLN